MLAFRVNQRLRRHGGHVVMRAARAGVVEDDVGRAQLGMGGGDPREWRRDVSERGGARVGLALAAEDRRIGRLDVTLVEARREAVGADRAEPDHRARQRDREREGQRTDRSEEHTSELPSLMSISYAVCSLKKKK